MTELSALAKKLDDEKLSLIVCNNGVFFTSAQRGIAPIMQLLTADPGFLSGALAADKIVGKAAALLFAFGKVASIYAGVVSRPALDVFSAHGVSVEYGRVVSNIINRDKTGICPMEQAVLNIFDPEEAFLKLCAATGRKA